ncbi:RNA-binding protein [Phenylobacterium sp.]|uniref:RNA-binding protein n=1 Tax=Phenylobacterium sp. TaxID=1871053 RepID=UPI002733B12A|nr:RNA-binding protein [Phenylobacterium sp.]MDP3658944.1 RNA-binding protein [Phenylobacterium sp.]
METAHAAAAPLGARERRDIVSGEVMDEARLIRFVPGPGGVVTPDLARKLPGRGLWVAADRKSLDAAAQRNQFSRAAKAKLVVPPDLSGLVTTLLKKRLLAGLGLARRAGDLTSGFEKVSAAISSGRCAWMIEAADGAEDGRRKLLNLARRQSSPPRLFGAANAEELGLALGLENVIHTAFLAGRAAERWGSDVLRFSGFSPLVPESWCEEPSAADGTHVAPRAAYE